MAAGKLNYMPLSMSWHISGPTLFKAVFSEEGGPLARCFLNSIEVGGDGDLRFLEYAWGLAKQAGYKDISFIPDEIWEQAENTYDWILFQPK